jgi:hypothetical protein
VWENKPGEEEEYYWKRVRLAKQEEMTKELPVIVIGSMRELVRLNNKLKENYLKRRKNRLGWSLIVVWGKRGSTS